MSEVNGKMNKTKSETLSDFIKANHDLLTAMGVFGGLTTLFTRLENASYLVLISFMMFLVLSFEFWRKFPKTFQTTLSLYIFENLTFMLVISVSVYILGYYFMDLVTYMPILIISVVGFLYFTSVRITIAFFFQRHKTTHIKSFGFLCEFS
jgi:hypothetical protein